MEVNKVYEYTEKGYRVIEAKEKDKEKMKQTQPVEERLEEIEDRVSALEFELVRRERVRAWVMERLVKLSVKYVPLWIQDFTLVKKSKKDG